MKIENRIESAFRLLKSALEMASSVSPSSPQVIRRVEVEIAPLNLLEELRRVNRFGRYFWSSREKYFEMAGWGEADVVTGDAGEDFSYDAVIQRLQEKLSSISFGVRYYGGFKFDPLDGRGERWKSFKSYRFVVPLLEIIRRTKGTFLCANLVLGSASDLARQISVLTDYLHDWVLSPEKNLSDLISKDEIDFANRVDIPNFDEWKKLVSLALDAISSDKFKKVVMARETTFNSKNELDPITILSKVLTYAEKSYAFCFNPVSGRAFLGISPECLFKVISTYLETEALAGTASRNGDEDEIKVSLLNNSKELHEHSLVVTALKDALATLTTYVQCDDKPSIFELPNLYHLHTKFRGVIGGDIGISQILASLHPTPAIGGYPKESALKWLKDNEPIDRGVYSGPVGWVSYDSAEFCVGIRSALVQKNEISLYAGAGIVEGSVPEHEWNELEQKIKSFLNIISS